MTTKNEPLTSWNCDVCHQQIADSEVGNVIWRGDNIHQVADFQIVHKSMDGYACDPGHESGWNNSYEIGHFLSHTGRAFLLSWLTRGPIMAKPQHPMVTDFDQYADLFHRVQTPWYEEARPHCQSPQVVSDYSESGPDGPYEPIALERIASGEALI